MQNLIEFTDIDEQEKLCTSICNTLATAAPPRLVRCASGLLSTLQRKKKRKPQTSTKTAQATDYLAIVAFIQQWIRIEKGRRPALNIPRMRLELRTAASKTKASVHGAPALHVMPQTHKKMFTKYNI